MRRPEKLHFTGEAAASLSISCPNHLRVSRRLCGKAPAVGSYDRTSKGSNERNQGGVRRLEENWQPGILTNYATKSIQASLNHQGVVDPLLEDIKRGARYLDHSYI